MRVAWSVSELASLEAPAGTPESSSFKRFSAKESCRYLRRLVRESWMRALIWFAQTRPKLASFLSSPGMLSPRPNQRDSSLYETLLSLASTGSRSNASTTSLRTRAAILYLLERICSKEDTSAISLERWTSVFVVVLSVVWNSSPRASMTRSLTGLVAGSASFESTNWGSVPDRT